MIPKTLLRLYLHAYRSGEWQCMYWLLLFFSYMQHEAFEVNGFYFWKWHSISEAWFPHFSGQGLLELYLCDSWALYDLPDLFFHAKILFKIIYSLQHIPVWGHLHFLKKHLILFVKQISFNISKHLLSLNPSEPF